jgi:hypothetical protein
MSSDPLFHPLAWTPVSPEIKQIVVETAYGVLVEDFSQGQLIMRRHMTVDEYKKSNLDWGIY